MHTAHTEHTARTQDVGRGLSGLCGSCPGLLVERQGSRCTAEPGSLAVSQRGDKQVTTELQTQGLCPSCQKRGCRAFFLLLFLRFVSFPLVLLLVLLVDHPSRTLSLSAASRISSISNSPHPLPSVLSARFSDRQDRLNCWWIGRR